MIFLDQDGFAKVLAMVLAAAHADRIFFERAQAGSGFSRIQNLRAPVPSTARTKRRVSVATPLRRCNKFKATRSPVKRARAEARTTRGDLSRSEFLAVVINDFRFGGRDPKGERLRRTTQSLQGPAALWRSTSPRARLTRRDNRFRGDVARANVLSEKGLQ